MSPFVLGLFCGAGAAILVLFVVGAFLVAHAGDAVDNAADEHGEALGFDPGIRVNMIDANGIRYSVPVPSHGLDHE